MECFNCPYIKDELDDYMNRFGYAEIKDHPGFEEDVVDMIAETCWCDKIGQRIGLYGKCTSNIENNGFKSSAHSYHKKDNKFIRNEKYKNRLKKLASNNHGYPCAARYITETYVKGEVIKTNKPYLKRYYKGKNYTYYKKQSNRKLRRFSYVSLHGNQYRKVYDLWNNYI